MPDAVPSMTDAPEDATPLNRWSRRAGIVVVLMTAYVLLTSVGVRVVYLTSYDELLQGLNALEPARLLRDGGIFAFLVRVLRSSLIERAADRMLPRVSSDSSPPSDDPPDAADRDSRSASAGGRVGMAA